MRHRAAIVTHWLGIHARIRDWEDFMRPFLPVVSLAILMGLSMPALAEDSKTTPTISIQGRGEVVAAPDTAAVTAGVTTQGATAREALDANTKAMASLIATLKTAGVEAKDIQTSDFSVSPQYLYSDKDANGDTPPPRITGYNVQNGVNVKIRKLADLGKILDQIVTAGSNTINGVSFSVEDPAKLFDEARKAAFADAEGKAKTYADTAGVGLGSIISISEDADASPPQPVMFKAMAARADAAPVPVEAGQLTFDVSASVMWALKTSSD